MAVLDSYVDTSMSDITANNISTGEKYKNVTVKQFSNNSVDNNSIDSSICIPAITSDNTEINISKCLEDKNSAVKDSIISTVSNNPTSVEVADLLQKYSSPNEKFCGVLKPRLTAEEVEKLISSYENPSDVPTPEEALLNYDDTKKTDSKEIYEKLCAHIDQHILDSNRLDNMNSYNFLKNTHDITNSLNYYKKEERPSSTPFQSNIFNYANENPIWKKSKNMYKKLSAYNNRFDIGGNKYNTTRSYYSMRNRNDINLCGYPKKQIKQNNTAFQFDILNDINTNSNWKESEDMYEKLGAYSNRLDIGKNKHNAKMEWNRNNIANNYNYTKKPEQPSYVSSNFDILNNINTDPFNEESKEQFKQLYANINQSNIEKENRATNTSHHSLKNRRGMRNSLNYLKTCENHNNIPLKSDILDFINLNLKNKKSTSAYEKFGTYTNERHVGGKDRRTAISDNLLKNCYREANPSLYPEIRKQRSCTTFNSEILNYCKRFIEPNIYDRLLIKYNLLNIFEKHSIKNFS